MSIDRSSVGLESRETRCGEYGSRVNVVAGRSGDGEFAAGDRSIARDERTAAKLGPL